jgi:integrase
VRVYKPTYRDRRGKTREASRWAIEFRDRADRVRRIAAFEDKAASVELGRKVQRLVSIGSAGHVTDPALSVWITHLPPGLRATLAKVGVLDISTLEASRPISAVLEDFLAEVRAGDCSEDWVRHLSARIKGVIEACGIEALPDFDGGEIAKHLHGLRQSGKISARESNHRVQALRELSRWALRRDLLVRDPLLSLSSVNARIAPAVVRRALRHEELRKLVQAAFDGPVHRGVDGPTRSLAWRLAASAGLRVGEILTLQVRDLDLEAKGGPMLRLRANETKNRHAEHLPLALDLARDLAPRIKGKLPIASVLDLPPSFKTKAPRWLQFDLKAAGIPYKDESDRVADVHSLRSSFVTALVCAQGNVRASQRLARHSTAELTLSVYSRIGVSDERAALAALPSLAPTGTDDLASCLASKGAAMDRDMPRGASMTPCDARVSASRCARKDPNLGSTPLSSTRSSAQPARGRSRLDGRALER